MYEVFEAIEQSGAYWHIVLFYGFYPVVTSFMWVLTAMMYFFRYDLSGKPDVEQIDDWPFVTVLIPAYFEESGIAASLRGLTQLDYPNYEVIVINDGSEDRTVEEVLPFLKDPRVRLLDKRVNEGKGMALNDAIPCARGELVLVMDGDTVPEKDVLKLMAAHFRSPRVGAVSGNARVRNRKNMLTSLQAVEFSSVIGLLRRAQRIWGRVMCVSGVCGMFRRTLLIQAGMYSPGMATEDIDLTFKLQMLNYTVRYEARARRSGWKSPRASRLLWKQRTRWALGLGQALKRHRTSCGRRSSTACFRFTSRASLSGDVGLDVRGDHHPVVRCGLWGYLLDGGSLIPNWFGAMIGRCLPAAVVDRRCDRLAVRAGDPARVPSSRSSIRWRTG